MKKRRGGGGGDFKFVLLQEAGNENIRCWFSDFMGFERFEHGF